MGILEEKKKAVEKEFNSLNTYWELNYILKFSNRMTRLLGSCNYDDKTIKISIPYLVTNEMAVLIDTIRHEIAHAVNYVYNGKMGHGAEWQQIAMELNCSPNRCVVSVTPPLRPGTA